LLRKFLFALVALAAAPFALAAEPPAAFLPPEPPAAFAAPADAEPETATDPKASSVLVQRDMGNGTGQAGTGTVIASENGKCLVLSNAHVVENDARPLFVRKGAKVYPATFVASSRVVPTGPGSIHVEGPDLALVVIDADLPAVKIADARPAPGARLRQFGYGGRRPGDEPSFKEGKVTANRYANDYLTGTLVSQSGDSGSGLFNDQGELVGVTWGGTLADPTAHVMAVPLPVVKVYVAASTERKGLFPRLRERLKARFGKNDAKPEAKQPAEPPAAKVDPKKPVAEPKKPESKGVGSTQPPPPPGEGWMWDPTRKVYWKWNAPRGSNVGVGGNCPGGVCPLPGRR
jgi:S1-C subfamily serine protease